MRHRILGAIAIAACIAAAPACPAATPVNLGDLAPFINGNTVAVTRVDLARLDIALATKQWLQPFAAGQLERQILSVVVDQVQAWSHRLKAEGVTHFYVVSSLEFIPNPEIVGRWRNQFVMGVLANTTFAVVPGASRNAVDELHRQIQSKAKQAWPGGEPAMLPDCRQVRGAAVIGMGTLLDKVAAMQPAARPEFETALASAGDYPLQWAGVPPAMFARAATEILRDPLPGGDKPLGPVLARGFRWMALGADPDLEKFAGQVIIQSADAQSARAFGDAIKLAIADMVKRLDNGGPVPGILGVAQLFALVPEAKDDKLVATLDGAKAGVFRAFAQAAFGEATQATFRNQSLNNLKAIGLSLLNYDDKHKQFPDRAIRDKNGKPLLSWRVAILQDLDDTGLFKEFHLDEPWDSEHNRKLIDRMPDAFRSPDTGDAHPGRTRYLAPVGENLAFRPQGGNTLKDFTDGTSQTIVVVEVDPEHAVIWTKPDDIEIDLENPARGLFHGNQPLRACWTDGSARTVRRDVDLKVLRALFTRNGGESMDNSKY